MKIWIFNNYNMLPEHGALNRHYYFGKSLKAAGHEPTVFVGSHPHNTDLQLIEGREKFTEYQNCEFPWILIKTCNYEGSKVKRVYSMVQYYLNLMKAVKHFEKPDAIIGSSAHPLAAVAAIKLGKKYHCKALVEIRDLWPESIVAYGIRGKKDPVIQALYKLEKWIYTKADAVIFTMAGGRDYIIDKGWDTDHGGTVDLRKVYHINNGVDLEQFDNNAEKYVYDGFSKPTEKFVVTYTGSVRLTNNVGLILDAAEIAQKKDSSLYFIICGTGDQLEALKDRQRKRNLDNLLFCGYVEKKYIPYILERSDANLTDMYSSELFKYGISPNKLFEYFASGKPIISGLKCGYDLIKENNCGIVLDKLDGECLFEAVQKIKNLKRDEYNEICSNARKTADEHDFNALTEKLITIIEELT